jgi:VanZ family protein
MRFILSLISYVLSIRQSVRVFLVVIYVGFIAALSLLPPQDLPQVPLFRGADKLIHCGMYFIFSVLSCWTLKTELNYSRLFFIVVGTVGWGILMEYLQLDMHRGRSFSWYDELANSIGVTFGILIYILVTRRTIANSASKSV